VNCSFESFRKLYDTGRIAEIDDPSEDIFMVPQKDGQGSPFLNSYRIIVLRKNIDQIPDKLKFLIPFIKVQTVISKAESDDTILEEIEPDLWQKIWDHISFLYVYSAHIAVKDPWEHSLKEVKVASTEDNYDLLSFYDNFNHTPDCDLEYYLLNNFKLPGEYVQKALVKAEIGKFIAEEFGRLFGEYKSLGNSVDEELLEKIFKWPSHLSKMNTLEFIDLALNNWSTGSKSIDPVKLSTLMILFTVDCYYARLDLLEILQRAQELMVILRRYRAHIKAYPATNTALFFALGKLDSIVKVRDRVTFFPDYLKLTKICAGMYDYVKSNDTLSSRWFDPKSSKRDTDYLHIGIKGKGKLDKYSIEMNSDHLNQISNIPPYIFIDKIRDFLLCNAELMSFTEQYLKIDPTVFYKELTQAKAEGHYHLDGPQVLARLLAKYENQIQSHLSKNYLVNK
jgi:hypothetical protein